MSPSKASLLSTIHTWTRVAPLMGAVFAPFSVLFDIPALTDPWFIHFDPDVLLNPNKANSIPSPTASIALSATSLAFNVIANALLIVRFSASAPGWRVATRMSLVFWVSKGIIATVNLCVFGRLPPQARRGEGLWCAVVSLVISGLITFMLLCHWGFELHGKVWKRGLTDAQVEVRVAGRHFMINVTLFVIDLALLALLASRVEQWTYLQGIYYSQVTLLTIGFGDFYPTHTVTRILLFVFALVGIAQLGNIISMLVVFFGSCATEKRSAARERFEREHREAAARKSGRMPDLDQEIRLLHHLSNKEAKSIRREQLAKSVTGLVVFWVVGAAIFSTSEGWAYGTALYVMYVSFLTIGYGDFAPITPAGRVLFILYALFAVPVMASFAVQAVQHVFSAFSARQYDKRKAARGLIPIPVGAAKTPAHSDRIVPHAELTEAWHRNWEAQVRGRRKGGYSNGEAQKLADEGGEDGRMGVRSVNGNDAEQEREFDEDAELTNRVLELALTMEWRARKLLIMHLGEGSGDVGEAGGGKAARIILKADQNVQLREVRGLLREIEEEQASQRGEPIGESDADKDANANWLDGAKSAAILKHIMADEPDEPFSPSGNDERVTLREVRRYREDFAGLLAAGSRLMGLKGNERALFERRRLLEANEHEVED